MSKSRRLTRADREFLQRIVRVVYSNPFGAASDDFKALVGTKTLNQIKRNGGEVHYHNYLLPILTQRLNKIADKGIASLKGVAAEDRRVLESAYLFEIFHEFTENFDDLILSQQQQGDQPVNVPFAPKIIKRFQQRGLTNRESYRMLAFFYQIRRAYRFIQDGLIGESTSMHQLRLSLWNNIFTNDTELFIHDLWDRMEDFSTLLLGATGTGKGAAALAIGRSGHIPFDVNTGRFKNSFSTTFSAINLSQFPENLIESELFGHRKGAFTGAIDQHKGIFERCLSNGTLFIDEIGDVSIPIQIKLLNVLQERLFTPVGSHEIKRFNGRVVAATNHSLDLLREQGAFREDFYYRLSSDVIHMPSLQQRLEEHPGELELLVIDLVGKMFAADGGHIVDRVMAALQVTVSAHYHWPGNVRELRQAIRRIVLTGRYDPQPLAAESLSEMDKWLRHVRSGELSADQLLTYYLRFLYEKSEGNYQTVAKQVGMDWRTVKRYL